MSEIDDYKAVKALVDLLIERGMPRAYIAQALKVVRRISQANLEDALNGN